MSVITACRKTDRMANPGIQKEKTNTENFFTIPSGTDPRVKSIAEHMKKQNETLKFADALIKNAGYPRWEKAKIYSTANLNTLLTEGENPEDTTVIYVPFTLDNATSAILTIAINLFSSGDTAYNIIYPQHYKVYGFDTTLPRNSWNSRQVFTTFADFDRDIFGTDEYIINDGRIFGMEETDTMYAKRMESGWGTDVFSYNCESWGFLISSIEQRTSQVVSNIVIVPGPNPDFIIEVCTATYLGMGGGDFFEGDPNPFAYPGPIGSGGGGNGAPGGLQDLSNIPQCPVAPRMATEGPNLDPCAPGWVPIPITTPPPTEPIDSLLARYSRAIKPRTDSLLAKSLLLNWEHSMIIVNNGSSIYLRNEKTSQDSLSTEVNFSLSPGEVLLGYIHCHSSASSNMNDRSAPSGSDVKYLREKLTNNFVQMTECGNAGFAMVIEDITKARIFLDAITKYDLDEQLYNNAQAVSGWFSNWQNATQVALINLLGSSLLNGIGFYKSTDSMRESWIKLN